MTMTKEQLDALVAQAKSLTDLVNALVEAQDTTPTPGADTFTQAEADEVCKAVQALVTPVADTTDATPEA